MKALHGNSLHRATKTVAGTSQKANTRVGQTAWLRERVETVEGDARATARLLVASMPYKKPVRTFGTEFTEIAATGRVREPDEVLG